ncbi:MAG: TetR/AcrR family transcriptional regulator [Dehalococcoidia bacterium]
MLSQPNRQALRTQRTRDQIVQAALTVFALKGFSAASMDDVSLAAGCSKGGLYHHFPSKSSVLAGVVERLIRSNALLPPFESDDGALPLSPAAVGRVLLEVWTEAARSSELRAQLRAGYEARLDKTLTDRAREGSGLAEILRIGTLIQLLARGEAMDANAAAIRLGIGRAA